MPKRLSDSAGTGKKIMKNITEFKYQYISSEKVVDKDFHTFEWTFGKQSGTVVIQLTEQGYIDQSSTLNCDKYNKEFKRPLGAYNDDSLYEVFVMLLNSEKIDHK